MDFLATSEGWWRGFECLGVIVMAGGVVGCEWFLGGGGGGVA